MTVEPTETLAGGEAVIPVKNNGNVHLALNATMQIQTPFGENVEVNGGFGRWVLPGDEGDVKFRVKGDVPSGTYQTSIKIKTGHGKEPITLNRTLNID